MTETVRLRGGGTVALRPCQPWCTEERHFPDGTADPDDGYHHYGTETAVPTGYPFTGTADGELTVVRVVLKSWTHPLDADPGPARIEINLGTAEAGTDFCVELTPAEALAVARAVLNVTAAAEQET